MTRRFLAKIDFAGPDDCWEWTGARHPFGHGRLRAGTRSDPVLIAHRVAWMYWVGPIPDGMQIRHTCDNAPCCNPAHLLIGAQADNVRDMVQRRRHGGEKLTPDMVRDIRSRSAGPRGYVNAMAAEFGVVPQTITDIRHDRTRRDVH